MALVGDIIEEIRSLIPDQPPTLPAPTASFAVVSATGSTLPAGNYFLEVTQRNPWGETLATAESTVQTVGANQGIQVTSALLPGATTIRAYLTLVGGVAGSEIQFVESTTSPFTISTPPTGAGSPPSRSTAYLPDLDGGFISATKMFSWLNDGLKNMSRLTGGILDYSGVGTVAGQPLYTLTGQWLKITDVWYNGYWVQGGHRGDFFRRNAIKSGILNSMSISVLDDRVIMEVYYQPDRNAGSTTTTATMQAGDTSIALTSTGVFLLPFGFAQIGTEIVAYSQLSGGVMSGIVRRLGGTVAQIWASGTTVNELNLFFCGTRVFTTNYVPGNSGTTLPVPPGWETILPIYMNSRVLEIEKKYADAKRMRDQFTQETTAWYRANKPVETHVQVGGSITPMTYANTPAGGVIVP